MRGDQLVSEDDPSPLQAKKESFDLNEDNFVQSQKIS